MTRFFIEELEVQMSYRNDHDAAIARVDALQQELNQLAAENERLRSAAPAPPRAASKIRRFMLVAACMLAAPATVALCFSVGVAGPHAKAGAQQPLPAPSEAAAAPTEPVAAPLYAIGELDRCALAIGARPQIELHTPDLAAVERTEAPCRSELHRLASDPSLGEHRRALLADWAGAEDRLANRISLIHEYYTTNRGPLENYATAPQLWNEYAQIAISRDAVLAHWLPED